MAAGDRVSDIQRSQIALETLAAPGTAVTPTNKLTSMTFVPAGDWETRTNKSGAKVARTQTLTKDKSTGKFQTDDNATPTYGELGLLLAGVLVGDDGTNTGVALAPTVNGTTAQDWTFFLKPEEKDTRQTFTVQKGDDTFGEQVSGVSLQDFTLEFTQDSLTITANTIGNRLRSTVDGLTPAYAAMQTGLPTITDNQITIEPGSICVYMSRVSRADLDTQMADPANALQMVKRGKWSVKGRSELWDPVRCDGSNYAVEGLEADCMIKAEADPTVMALVQHLRGVAPTGGNDQKRVWVGIQATGPEIDAGVNNYGLTIVSSFFVSGISEIGPDTKLEAAEFSFVFAYDEMFDAAANPGFCEVVLTNAQTALLA
jgi:hypothetical protein